MKKILPIVLCLLLLLGLIGCSVRKAELEDVPLFYYLRAEPTYGEADSVIASAQLVTASGSSDLDYLLALYFAGPTDDHLRSPYPNGTKVTSIEEDGSRLVITLNAGFAQLTGLDLTKACACLSMTVFGITDAQVVSIQAENATLDNARSIDIARDSLVLQETIPEIP